jgi:hypothetical protein
MSKTRIRVDRDKRQNSEVLVAPYLPLARREIVGPWELIPRSQITHEDVSQPQLLEAIQQLLDAYLPQRKTEVAFGVSIRDRKGRIGQAFDRTAPGLLRNALLAASLDTNPSPLMPEEEQTGHEGHQIVTSDNTLVYGHPLNSENWVADQYGVMATRLVGGMRLGEANARFEPPGEVVIPAIEKPFDDLYATAIYEELTKASSASRRIGRALGWLSIAWRNTSAVDIGTRVVALRAGFEVLLGVGDKTQAIRTSLGGLLNPSDAARTERTWIENGKSKGPFLLTDIEWWFQRLSLLRNGIMHGDDIPGAMWEHEGQSHIWIGEHHLRSAIKETLIGAGHPDDLREVPSDRALKRRITQFLSEDQV